MPRNNKKFNLQRGIAGVKREAKKLPKATVKQLPNAALFLSGGATSSAARLATKAVKKRAAQKAANQTVKIIKIKGNKPFRAITR